MSDADAAAVALLTAQLKLMLVPFSPLFHEHGEPEPLQEAIELILEAVVAHKGLQGGIAWLADRLPATDPLHARIVPWLWNTGFTYPRRASYHDDDGSTWLEFEDRSQEIAAVRALWFDVRDACGLRDLVPTMPSE
ncbi:MAG: hypothetical protein KC621_29150 [Myxococcales bacterium]|nr:hypothetical protein [Myxococcales bacterium]